MRRLAAASVLVLLTVLAAPGRAAPDLTIPADVQQAARAQITAPALAAPIRILSSDAFEGRGPATRGDTLARLYLATELQALGYAPGGVNGGWEQPVDLIGVQTHAPATWSFQTKSGDTNLVWRDDYIAASGVQEAQALVRDAELVFVGYGIQAPEYHWDDFKRAKLAGKILVMMNNDPDWDPKLFAGNRRLYYGRWMYKYESAARQGAAGAIIIHTTSSAGYPWQVVQSSWSGEQFGLPAEGEPQIQLKAWATESAMRRLLQAAGFDLDKLIAAAKSRNFHPVALGIRTSISTQNDVHRVRSANVLGLLPGSDPKLRSQVVIYSAHHDHFGIGAPDATGDRIYHGAIDNASGCAQVLSIAKAYAALPQRPRRSVLIMFVAGEEQGLIGSLYYARHPTVPLANIAVDVNYDGGNKWGHARDVISIGLGKSTTDRYVAAAAALQGRRVDPDAFPDRGYFYRADQFSFAKYGVPGVYLHGSVDFIGHPAGWGREQREQWELTRYHQPGDRLESDWNFDGMIDDATLGFWAGWLMAQADDMPVWNPGDEFEAARKRTLAEPPAAHP